MPAVKKAAGACEGHSNHKMPTLADIFHEQVFAMKESQYLNLTDDQALKLKKWILAQALDLGFADAGVAPPDTSDQMRHLKSYLERGHQGSMSFLEEHSELRADPAKLVEGTRSVISVRMDYLVEAPPARHNTDEFTGDTNHGIIARYARGRDYHKVMRGRLKQLAKRIETKLTDMLGAEIVQGFVWRPFSDSAPVFEKTLAERAGLGWTGKHTLLIHPKAGSFFVLGELFTSLELPIDEPLEPRCGSCSACIDICPTKAIVAPYQLDARRCIAYLTIEHIGAIPHEFREAIGNRIFGCDDCQLICPWNRFAGRATLPDFDPRHGLDAPKLLELWSWSAERFDEISAGSPLRRLGYAGFRRNVALAMGNAPQSTSIAQALSQPVEDTTVDEQRCWSLERQINQSL